MTYQGSLMDTENAAPVTTRAYLIVLKHVVVAQDIAMSIAEYDPGARVIVVASIHEAPAALADVQEITLAFVGEGPRSYAGSELHQALEARNGRVVLIGEDAELEGEAQGWAVLYRPFSSDAMLEALREAGFPRNNDSGRTLT